MYNWWVDEKRFKKQDLEGYRLWRLTQLINYGLDEEKLDRQEVKRNWCKIKDRLDPHKVAYLEFVLWGRKPSSRQFKENFWSLS